MRRPLPFDRTGLLAACLLVGGLALAFRVSLLSTPAAFDELYHLLAARGWLETGRPAILDGEYTRTRWFTIVVARLFQLAGDDTLRIGRLISLVAGILIPVVLFLWLRAAAGWGAALIGAALAIFWPQGIQESQFLRFYSWHALSFLVGAVGVFQAVGSSGTARASWTVLALGGFWIALYLQVTTAIGVAAILVWLALVTVLPGIWKHRLRWTIFGAVLLLTLAALALLLWSGALQEAWTRYRWSAAWASERRTEVTFYHTFLRELYPVLWPLLPVWALIALRRQPQIGWFCLILFGIVFVGLSFGGMKSTRYLSYGMPFFFAIVAIALAAILPAVSAFLARAARELTPAGSRPVAALALSFTGLFVLLANPFMERSLDAARGKPQFPWYLVDWSEMGALLGDWDEVPFRMTTNELQTLYEVGDYDVLINESRLTELPSGEEGAVDPRVGRPVISKPETVAAALRCHPDGVLLTERSWWVKNGWSLTLMPIFAEAGRQVETRGDPELLVVRWSGGAASPDDCAELPF